MPDCPAPPQGEGIRCRPALRGEVDQALRLILASHGRSAGDEQVIDFLSYAVHRGIDLSDLWVVERRGRIVWAAVPVVSPGGTTLLFVPGHTPRHSVDTLGVPLVMQVAEFCRQRSVQLLQVLLDPGDTSNRRLFESAGFTWLSQLIYLQRSLGRAPSLPAPALPAGFSWETYSAFSHDRFAQTIESSYQQSLDCPALNGLRSMNDVIAGHKSAGDFDPAWWLLLREQEALRAVLLLARSRHSETAELVYLGLAPAARGRGIGGILMRQALHLAARGGCARLSLAVDAQNTPALKLYYRHGMQRLCARDAMIRDLR